MARKETLTIRLTPSQLKAILLEAKKTGRTKSTVGLHFMLAGGLADREAFYFGDSPSELADDRQSRRTLQETPA